MLFAWLAKVCLCCQLELQAVPNTELLVPLSTGMLVAYACGASATWLHCSCASCLVLQGATCMHHPCIACNVGDQAGSQPSAQFSFIHLLPAGDPDHAGRQPDMLCTSPLTHLYRSLFNTTALPICYPRCRGPCKPCRDATGFLRQGLHTQPSPAHDLTGVLPVLQVTVQTFACHAV